MYFRSIFLSLVCVVFITGCGSFSPALKRGEEIPPGMVLVIGKFVIDPPWYMNDTKPKPGEEKLNIMAGITNDLSIVVKENKIYKTDINISTPLYDVFYYPFPPGTKYIRHAQVMKPIGAHTSGAIRGATVFKVLKLYRNIKLDVPERAKAVYIGTIVYRHDGKRLRSVAVRDEYRQALRDLAEMKIPGLRNRDVVKKLAVVK